MAIETWGRAVLICIFVVLGGVAPTRADTSESIAGLHSTHQLQYTVLRSGDVDVYERIEIVGKVSMTTLTRSFWLQPAPFAWPLLQRLDAISIVDDEGVDIAYRYREYELRANLDFLAWPESGPVHLRYRLHRALDLRTDQANWKWNVTGHQWQAAVDRVEIRIVYADPAPRNTKKLSMIATRGYSDNESNIALQERGGDFRFEWNPGAQPSDPVSFVMTLPTGGLGPVPSDWLLSDLYRLFRISLSVLGILFVLALVQLFVRPERVVAITRITNFAAVIPAMIAAFWATHYWYYESGHRGVGDDLSAEFIVNFGLAGFILLFAVKQYRLLGEVRRAAYFAQVAFPTVLLVAWPIAFVDRSMLLLPVLALPGYLYWFRPNVALDFGVGAHRIAEEVTVRGEVKTSELAKYFQLSEERLSRIVVDNPALLLVHDRKQGVLMSAETASLRKECLICRYCGGATESLAMAQVQCGNCGREYTSTKKSQGQAPMPVVVESLAIFVESLRDGIYYMALVIALAILFMEAVAGSVGAGLVGALIGGLCVGLPGLLVAHFAQRLRSGQSIGVARTIMLLAAPLIVPVMVWAKLRSRRVRIFASELSPDVVLVAMAGRGECSLVELSEYLKCSQEDAAELTWYLVANQLIDAVYDRRHNRLVERKLYRQIADEGDCDTCGGFYGVVAGQLRCHYCGSTK